MNAVHLRRVDPARNIGSTCSPIFSAASLLMKEWGRIGARGRMVAERYDTEALAAAACNDTPSARDGGAMAWRSATERGAAYSPPDKFIFTLTG